jgi:unsaturated rhamnogalacturonyl hydrolase
MLTEQVRRRTGSSTVSGTRLTVTRTGDVLRCGEVHRAHHWVSVTYANPHTNNLWDDTLMMTVIPLAQIGVLLNRPHYIEEAKYQFLLHIKYLTNPSTGLWYHGWEYTPEKGSLDFGHNFAGALWARGNAWITVSIPIFLEILGDRLAKDDPVRLSLIATLKRQVDALVACQDKETGMWHTLLVDPTSYVETSATAGFAAGIFMALRMVS